MNHLSDFSDRLSPMLVKELRQGLRARSFTMLFLIFQGLLGFILLFAGSSGESDGAGAFASGVIFTLFAIAALIFQPMRGINALSSEITGNTIEMMVLTRLSARRIVFGKWFAIVSQTALMLTSIVPYLVLRYFFGGMILIGEMVFLTLIFLTSMALTAVMVGASGTATKLIRVLPIMGFIFAAQVVPTFLFRSGFNGFMSFCSLTDWESRLSVLSYLALISYIGWCALSHGISAIAPSAENHSTLRRVIALALMIVTAAIGFFDGFDQYVILTAFAIIMAPAVITALTETTLLMPPIYKPFLKLGIPGRIASYFLLPGWPSGVFFTTLLGAIGVGTMVYASKHGAAGRIQLELAVVTLAITGGVLLPALLAACFSKQESKRFTNFMIFLLASVVLTITPAIIVNVYNQEKILWLFVWNPPVLIPMVSEGSIDKGELFRAGAIVNLIILAILMVRAILAFRSYRDVIRETQEGLASSPVAVLPTAAES